jgi:deoxyribodipyrimidine photo-lyase
VRTAIALFTRDLRVHDNPMFAAATLGADQTVPAFVFDRVMLERTAHGRPHRFGFLCQSLTDLDSLLRDRGGQLVVRRGEWVQEVLQLAYEAHAETVHVARDVSAFAQRRLARLRAAAEASGIEIVAHDNVTTVPPDSFGKPYLVFAPYYKKWLATEWRDLARVPRKVAMPRGLGSVAIPDRAPPGDWVGGETAARARLKTWTPRGLGRYEELHDDPAADATSRLSAALHFGCVSPLEVGHRLYDRDGSAPFLRQICWRDFFAQLLWSRPEAANTDVRPRDTAWADDPESLAAWKEGRTGFPLVDAGMRQLRAEGWMHNRVRMVVASFLTKDLHIDWREGAAYFMDMLVDGDVANNQLNWQWVAGTGTDTNPHRVLNPSVQLDRHDPDRVYTRRWIPEFDTPRYPAPIVDHKEAIAAWRASRAALRS